MEQVPNVPGRLSSERWHEAAAGSWAALRLCLWGEENA